MIHLDNKKRIKKKLIIYISLFAITSFFAVIIGKQKALINCFSIEYSNFNEVNKNIYLSPHINNTLQDSLINLVYQAENRNEEFWLRKPMNYTIIFCSSDKELKKYTGSTEIHSISKLTPFGTFIVLGKDASNIDVISHEISHSILLQLTGYKTLQNIPTWFNEGIALQVDYRSIMIDSIMEMTYKTDFEFLLSISNHNTFHNVDWNETRLHYLKSRYEIKQWLAINKDKLHLFLEEISSEDFIKSYKEFK